MRFGLNSADLCPKMGVKGARRCNKFPCLDCGLHLYNDACVRKKVEPTTCVVLCWLIRPRIMGITFLKVGCRWYCIDLELRS